LTSAAPEAGADVPEAAPPRIRPRSEHPISRSQIDPDALKVLYRLKTAGYKAYLVGGSVRDLLLGRKPKDFDIGTDASPQAVRKLFRNCRLIGRRFRLAHILFPQGKVIEVATFRRRPEPLDPEAPELLMTSDNVFGTAREDALRRDFTINGLFYNIADYSVIDYVGGLDDLDAVTAFQKLHGLPRTGTVDARVWRELQRAEIPRARYPGDHVEVSKGRQVLFLVRNGKVALVVPVSTGATGNTPLGHWRVYSRVPGYNAKAMYYSSFFVGGFAIHGYASVPPYPASHGCVRIPLWVAYRVFSLIDYGTAVYIYW